MLGERIRQARLEKGLSQRQLCGREITRNMLSQIESGKARPSMQTLTYLAKALEKPVGYFLGETASPAEQPLLQEARELYSRRKYGECLERLETAGRETAGEEGRLLQILATLELARESVREGRRFYARSLLEKLPEAAAEAFYYTKALERERLLILYETGADPKLLAEKLPADDRELLLRAQGFLEEGRFAEGRALLTAVKAPSALCHLLMGQADMGQGMYKEAIPHLQRAEEAYPVPCARGLEICYRELEDFKMAYHYACKQKK